MKLKIFRFYFIVDFPFKVDVLLFFFPPFTLCEQSQRVQPKEMNSQQNPSQSIQPFLQ